MYPVSVSLTIFDVLCISFICFYDLKNSFVIVEGEENFIKTGISLKLEEKKKRLNQCTYKCHNINWTILHMH